MKIMETATFRFCFKDINSREDSYKILKQFLKDNDWVDERGNKRSPLDSFHSEDSGECEVILAEETTIEDFIDLIEEVFVSIKDRSDTQWIKTYYNENTSNLVYSEAEKYQINRSVILSDLKYGDEVYIYISK